jgi:hypothetical protein
MHELIERFRYRFQLWWRDRREDYIGPPGTHLPNYFDDSIYSKPKYTVLVTESAPRAIVRSVSVYFSIIFIAAQLCRLLIAVIPATRDVISVIFLIFVTLWTLLMILSSVGLHKARKARRSVGTKSSNQTMQLTADRRGDPVSIHEPPYTPDFPRFRQR